LPASGKTRSTRCFEKRGFQNIGHHDLTAKQFTTVSPSNRTTPKGTRKDAGHQV